MMESSSDDVETLSGSDQDSVQHVCQKQTFIGTVPEDDSTVPEDDSTVPICAGRSVSPKEAHNSKLMLKFVMLYSASDF